MNRPALEALRRQADDLAHDFAPHAGEGSYAAWTPPQAYAGARYHAAMQMRRLLDALLAPDAATPITCATCGRVAQPGEVLKIVDPGARVCCPLCAPAPTLSNNPGGVMRGTLHARPVALWETA